MSTQVPQQYVAPPIVTDQYGNVIDTNTEAYQQTQERARQRKEYESNMQQIAAQQKAAAEAKALKQKQRNEQAAFNNIPKVPKPAPVAKVIPNPFAGGPSMADFAAQKAAKALKQKQRNEQAAFDNIPKVSAKSMIPARRMKEGGSVSKGSSASKRADGIAQRGKTRGKMC